ncbi:hypothetical protein MMC16_002890 [Acarospora aff. strigata]|nr:hypothetical protein [Acarospora aff. strigata]
MSSNSAHESGIVRAGLPTLPAPAVLNTTPQSIALTANNLPSALAFQASHGRGFVPPFNLPNHQGDLRGLKRMCAQLDGVLIAPVGWGWIPKVFTKIRIGTAKIQQLVAYDLEHRPGVFRVRLRACEYQTILQKAFGYWHWDFLEGTYFPSHGVLAVGPTSIHNNLAGRKVIFVKTVPDKAKIAWQLIFLIVVGLLVGNLVSTFLPVGDSASTQASTPDGCRQGLAAWFWIRMGWN